MRCGYVVQDPRPIFLWIKLLFVPAPVMQVFTILALLNETRLTMGNSFGRAVQTASDAWVSIKRLENILVTAVSPGRFFFTVGVGVVDTPRLMWIRNFRVTDPMRECSRRTGDRYPV